MKRVFAYIGFSAAITQLVLCLVPMMYSEYIRIAAFGLATIFVASLFLPVFRRAEVVPLCSGVALFTCLLFLFNLNTAVLPVTDLDSFTADCVFYVTDNPHVTGSAVTYDAYVKCVNLPSAVQNFKTVVLADEMTELEPFREYVGSLDFYTKYNNAMSSFGQFSNRVYINSRLNYVLSAGDMVDSPMRFVLAVRNDVVDTMRRYLGDDYAGLSVALTTGSKAYLNSSVRSAFTNLGISHLTAVSGLHLSVITGTFIFVLRALKVDKRLAATLGILLTLFYIAFANFSGSVVRAGIMLVVLFSADFFNMRSDSLNSLGLAVAVMCLNPYAVTDIGSVLSVLCIIAVVVVMPAVSAKMTVRCVDPLNKTPSDRAKERLMKLLSGFYTSVIIAAVTMPVCYAFFGFVSVFSAVANIVAIPLGSLCVVFSLLLYLVSLLHIPFVTLAVASLTYILDGALIKCVTFFNSLGNHSFALDYRYGFVFACIFILICVAVLMDKKQAYKVCAVLCCAIFVVSSVTFGADERSNCSVYLTGDGAGVVRCENKNVVFGVSNAREYLSVADYLQSNSLSVDVLVSENDYFSSLICDRFEVSALICDEFNDTILNNSNKDYLIVNDTADMVIGNNSRLCFNKGRVLFDLNGFTVGNDDSADAFVSHSEIIDSNGIILLKNGDALYTINDKNTFSIRRFDNG